MISAIGALVFLTGCEAAVISLLGVSTGVAASTAINYTLDGIAYRTFTAPRSAVRTAVLTALSRMGMKLEDESRKSAGEIIRARATDRRIEVELEVLTNKTTRINTVAKHGLLYIFRDRATATEIILQTERALKEL